MSTEPVLVISRPVPHVVLLEMNRPSQHNAVDAALHQAMWKAFDAYLDNPDDWCLVLAGRGPSFSAGNDLKETSNAREKMKREGTTSSSDPGKDPSRGFGGWTMHPKLTKPVVAAVHGFALGGGLEMAMATDIVVASEDALFGMPETRVGMVAGTGSAQNLSRYLSLQRALDLLLTGRRLSSKLAQEWGLVSYISAPGREAVLKKALEVAATVVEASPDAQRATKALVLLGAEKGRLEAHKLTNTVPEYAAWGRGANVGEGTKAFAEKRKPSWHPLEKL